MDPSKEDHDNGDPGGSSRGSPSKRIRDQVTYYEKVWTKAGAKPTADETDAGPTIDVCELESRLRAEKQRRFNEDAPKIEVVRLRSTPQHVPHRPTNVNVKINVRTRPADNNGGGSPTTDDVFEEESVERTIEEGQLRGDARIFKYEKVTMRKSTREISISRSGSSFSDDQFLRSPSTEEATVATGIDDSAYQTRSHGAYSNLSKTSSNVSLDDQYDDVQQPMHSGRQVQTSSFETWSSSSYQQSGNGNGGRNVRVTASGPTTAVWVNVRDVASGNSAGRHQPRNSQSPVGEETITSDAKSFQTMAARMEFVRSNSQYDSHIKQIRGDFYFCAVYLDKKFGVKY